MRIAITGASGLLGRALLDAAGDKHQLVAAYHSAEILDRKYLEQYPFDLTDEKSIRHFVQSANADLIIHGAAITDVDLCEREPTLAQRLNADATRRMVDVIRNTSTRIVYISTDYVFDGSDGPNAETDSPNPINVYGRSKLDGEVAIQSLAERAAIVRSASFLGHGSADRPTFVERMLEAMRTRPPLLAASDQRSNVTPIDELANGIMRVIEAGASGIWHIAHPDILSRYELALMLAEGAGIDSSLVRQVKYESLNRDAARPLKGGLKSVWAARDLGISFRPIAESVRLFLTKN